MSETARGDHEAIPTTLLGTVNRMGQRVIAMAGHPDGRHEGNFDEQADILRVGAHEGDYFNGTGLEHLLLRLKISAALYDENKRLVSEVEEYLS